MKELIIITLIVLAYAALVSYVVVEFESQVIRRVNENAWRHKNVRLLTVIIGILMYIVPCIIYILLYVIPYNTEVGLP